MQQAIDIVVSAASEDVVDLTKQQQETVQVNQVKKGRVIQETYVLNDTAALKKKGRNETNRKEAFNTGADARDGSNVVILMKTSFFEHVKSEFMEDLIKMDGITLIDNAVGTKAQTANSGDAFVEYALDITFLEDKISHGVKFTAYATTCKIMIQTLGEKSNNLDSLGKKSVPRFFVDKFLLPWCETAFANKKYNEKEMLDAIKNEIVRLDLLKVDTKKGNGLRGRLRSVPSSDLKCVAKSCKYTGLNLNNKLAVGVCTKCGYFEHFECSRTKQEDREHILKGDQKYFCSICFSKNPAMVAFEGNKVSNVPKPFQLTASTKATPLAIETEIVFKCNDCTFVTKDQEEYKNHTKEKPEVSCETCKESMPNQVELKKHIKNKHTQRCITCDLEFKTISELKEHMKVAHGPECTICIKSFDKQEELEKHVAEKHNGKPNANAKHKCNECPESFDTTEDLGKHVQGNHTINCKICDATFKDKDEETHHYKSQHGISCAFCDYACKDNDALTNHLKEKHALSHACSICERDFVSKVELKEHMEKDHYSDCSICGEQFKTSRDLSAHLQECKIYTCGECNDIYYKKEDLDAHIVKKHRNECNICQDNFSSKPKLNEHILETHRFKCSECDRTEESKEEIERHVQETHGSEVIEVEAFECEYCDFEGRDVYLMMEHVIEKHTKKDVNNQFNCDDCSFKCNERGKLLDHFRKEHKKKPIDDKDHGDNGEEEDLKEEYRLLKNNFERLNTMFQDSLEEVDRVKSEYTAKLVDATEKYRVTLKENEELKEKVEILFKLGRSYIDRAEPVTTNESGEQAQTKHTNASANIDPSEQPEPEADGVEDLSAWTTNKFRGFRRVSPATSAQPTKETSPPKRTHPAPQPTKTQQTRQSPGAAPQTVNERLQNLARNDFSTSSREASASIQYCHYFTNFGKCFFEEKTGNKCRFEHKVAPMCQSGTACTRPKCMFTHPNTSGRSNAFLGRNMEIQNNMNPWHQMMNAFPNPWNVMQMNPFQQPTMFQQQPLGMGQNN